jgi:Leucine-rich repeat (LRR) protein
MDLDLTALSRIQVADNQLTSLPAEVGQLTQLEWLSVRNSN